MEILPCFLVSVAEATVLGINTHSIAPIPGQFEMIKRAGKYTFKIFRVQLGAWLFKIYSS